MENENMENILQQMQEETQEQNRLLRKQNQFLLGLVIVTGILCIVCFLSFVLLVPKAETALSDMKQITSQLTDANLGEVIQNVNQLAENSNAGMIQALEKLNSLDLETLNKAIQELQSIVQPLSRLFSR